MKKARELIIFIPITLCFGPMAMLLSAILVSAFSAQISPITFNKNFEGGSHGKIEALGESSFRVHVEGQCDERGRNRQANWYYFRMDNVKGREITLTLTDFVGEYNDRPGACPMNADTVPVFSYDNERWQHFAAMVWDDEKKEATLRFRPDHGSIWIAHIPPYTTRHLRRLLGDVERAPHATIEVIGKAVQGRDLHLITVTDPNTPENQKRVVWLIARQHAWETGTSWVMEGALRWIVSDDPQARALRERVVFCFVPMMDPDGCATGKVRFNANGYDVNRHWNEVDLRRKEFLRLMPEIWYVKKAIVAAHRERGIDLLLNLHNTETAEYIETPAGDERALRTMQRLYDRLAQGSSFDPGSSLRVNREPTTTTNSLYQEWKSEGWLTPIPVALMEQRIGTSKKLKRRLTVDDRLDFGTQLIAIMAEAAAN